MSPLAIIPSPPVAEGKVVRCADGITRDLGVNPKVASPSLCNERLEVCVALYSSSTWPSHSIVMPRLTDWEAGQPFS